MSCGIWANQLRFGAKSVAGHPQKNNEISDLQNVTIVRTITRTIGEPAGEFVRGKNCAEARSRSMPASEAEACLTECENQPVESLVFEASLSNN